MLSQWELLSNGLCVTLSLCIADSKSHNTIEVFHVEGENLEGILHFPLRAAYQDIIFPRLCKIFSSLNLK